MYPPTKGERVSRNSVCEFGNQRLDKSLQRSGFVTTKGFYAAQGYTRYVALDVNEKMDAVVCDLNKPVDHTKLGQFDLVTDNGTGEHLFNQYAVWENQHRLTRTGGVLLKIMPFTPWLNHGFYNFNPILYRDIAAANNYKWLFFWITTRDSKPQDLSYAHNSTMFVEKRPDNLMKYVKMYRGTELYMVAAWVKRYGGPFNTPLQGKYVKDVADGEFLENYSHDPR